MRVTVGAWRGGTVMGDWRCATFPRVLQGIITFGAPATNQTCVAASVVGQAFIYVRASGGSHPGSFVTGVALTLPRPGSVDTLVIRHAAAIVRFTLIDVDAPGIPYSVSRPPGVAFAGTSPGSVGAQGLCKQNVITFKNVSRVR